MITIDTASTSAPGCAAGAWRLPPRQAMSLRPAQAGWVRVACGRVWATFDGPHPGPGNARGDHVLAAGDLLELRQGERVVVEPADPGQPAYLEWEPAALRAGAPAARVLRKDAAAPAAADRRPLQRLLLALAPPAVVRAAASASRRHA